MPPNAEQLRMRAEQCQAEAELATTPELRNRYERLANGWKAVGEAQAWLDGEPADGKAEQPAPSE